MNDFVLGEIGALYLQLKASQKQAAALQARVKELEDAAPKPEETEKEEA
jgi:hypothetical protein